MPAKYHLRFQLHPGAEAARQAGELAKFCGGSGVEEVVLLLGAEELYEGHPDGEQLFEVAATATAVLREAGLGVSLNPWVTAGHADRGRVDRLGFAPMVDPRGRAAAAQASFACPRWRTWLVGQYARYAELDLRVLWLEDDFRYHNHAPLHWGGGFEPLMLERFSARVGRPVDRERLVAAVTSPGEPHPWRALLQQVWRTAQLEVATAVARGVAERSGGRVQLGLMSSELGVHATEGRDWPALFQALSIGGRVAHRPHFARYSDAPGRELSFSVWMLEAQRALRPAGASSEPEIENWPHTTWSKSDTQTWSELVAAQLAGSDAMFLNLHPMQSGRALRFPKVAQLLRRSRPALDWVAAARPAGARSLGVALPVPAQPAAQVRTRVGGELAELAVDAQGAADYLLRYGVPVTAEAAPVAAVFGQLAWSLGDFEIEQLLTGGLLVDGTAAEILSRRGFGPLLGLRAVDLVDRATPDRAGPYAMERVVREGQEEAYLSVNVQPALARLTPVAEAEVWTEILTAGQQIWGPGRFVHRNRLGGRVAVLAATDVALLPFDEDGRALLHAAVRFLEGTAPALPLVSGGPHLIPQLWEAEGRLLLAIANGSADPARPQLHLPSGAAQFTVATLLAPLTPPTPARLTAQTDGPSLDQDLPHRGWLVVESH
ncbi:hypothetical protein C7C46_16510 [Streptomyces tateyamensis]|uniref:Uncharacterized protein n=1 Tax=Streptomyces tateyamensis TaxID=565073 RepID=A0A2V4NG73_9ACTN|nr:hypothetical protein [Streptomyces tateyamensis]PYC78237.1 hypothetical protein C7C46_16510 [Streptomyces tateyamensis]